MQREKKMDNNMSGKKIAILAANGFEESHMTAVQRGILAAGGKASVISTEQGLVNSWHDTNWGHHFPVDANVSETLSTDYDLLIVLGGEKSVVKLAENPHTDRIIKGFSEAAKPVVLMGVAVGILADLEMVSGLSVAAPESIVEKLTTAGATIVEDSIVMDGMFITGPVGDTEQAFVGEMIGLLTGESETVKQAA